MCLLPSETPGSAAKSAKAKANPTEVAYHQSFKTRDERRKKRIVATSTTALSNRTLERVASEIENFTDANGISTFQNKGKEEKASTYIKVRKTLCF